MKNGKTAGSKKLTKKPLSKSRERAKKTSKARRPVQNLTPSKNASEEISTAVNAGAPTTSREHVGESSSPSLLFWPTLPLAMMQIWFGPRERRL
jgi:hypothetical protein